MPTVLDPKALESHLPHRGCNLLPDRVEVDDGGKTARAYATVLPGDQRGREVMGRRCGAGQPCWYEPFVFEFLALTGIPLLTPRLAPAGQVAVFSSISRVVFHRQVPFAGKLVGHAEITRDRAPFTVFGTWAEVDGQRVLEAEVMSGVSTLAEVSGRPPKPLPLPPAEPIADAHFAWKGRSIRFVDGVTAFDPAAKRIVCSYTYPHDHPFVPGHFPGAPLMMGVTQFACVADAAWEAACRLGLKSCTASGSVRRPDGTEVAEVRELAIVDDNGAPRVASLRRIAFREPVRPGDTLLIDATLA
jgi:3-hydroxymyristoyl/3-hydroxydecanoyl-(acyl carrier protein) dehydratase